MVCWVLVSLATLVVVASRVGILSVGLKWVALLQRETGRRQVKGKIVNAKARHV